jgi:hydrocephalus-inducing protein
MVRDALTATSATGGKYTCVLFGNCEQPKPQGPIVIAAGQNVPVIFKNVLDSAETFNFTVDNPDFTLGPKKTEKLNQKASMNLQIGYKPEDFGGKGGKGDKKGDAPAPVKQAAVGKMLVSCPSHPGLSWVYYLRGTRE